MRGMLESTETLLPGIFGGVSSADPSSVVSVVIGFENESGGPESLEELGRLLTTLGLVKQHRMSVSLKKINPATYVGEGKVEEIKSIAKLEGAQCVIVDVELSPNQLRNLEKAFADPESRDGKGGLAVLDRPGVILEIFSRHARTKESKTQVALARMQYLLPRLSHFWSHFERQRGGGATSRGMGEKQLEVDRRLVKDRISILKSRLKEIEKERIVQRAGRKDVLKVALVGYTNAGKSTLLNALTSSQVLAEDKLFATLDASIRTLDPHGHPPVVAIDTVGFISNLPPNLIASFRSTLEELRDADLLLHVVDASSTQAREQYLVTEEVLKDLGLEKTPRIVALNKVDLLPAGAPRNMARLIVPGAITLSSFNQEDVAGLREKVLQHFRASLELWEVVIPYDESRVESQLYAHGSVETKRHLEKGTFYRVRMGESWAKKLGLERFKP